MEVTINDGTNIDDISHMKQTKRINSMKLLLQQLVTVTIELQDVLKTMYLPTPRRFHYVFTMRTLKRLFR